MYIELVWPIEWNLKPIEEEKGDELVDEKGAEAEEGAHDDRPLIPKRPREDEERTERRTSLRNSQEASPLSVEEKLEQGNPLSDPKPSTFKYDCDCPRCRGHKQCGLVSPDSRARSSSDKRQGPEGQC